MDAVVALSGRGLLTDDQRLLLAGFCKRWNCSAFQALIETNMISEASFADHASDILRLPRASNLREMTFSEGDLEILPFTFARSHACIILGSAGPTGAKTYRIAIADPWDGQSRLLVEDMVRGEVEWCVAERSDIIEAIDRNFPLKSIVPHFWGVISRNGHG